MMVRNAPESIWLNVGFDDEDCDFGELAEVSWCEEPIDDCDIEYRRVRRHSPPRAEAARYRAALEELANHSGTPTPGGYSVCDWCGVSVDAHQSWCASAIADRALHPEGTE